MATIPNKMNFLNFLSKLHIFSSIRLKLTIYFLVLSLLPIFLISYWAYDSGKQSTEGRVIAHLTSVADLKKSELEGWLSERMKNLQLLAVDETLTRYMKFKHLESLKEPMPDNEVRFEEIINKLNSFKTSFGYSRIIVINNSGRIAVSTEKGDIGQVIPDPEYRQPLATREIHIKDIFKSPEGAMLMSFAIPVYSSLSVSKKKAIAIVGVLILEMDMGKTLFPIMSYWPGMGKTGETLLVRKEEDEVLFLNQLRHQSNDTLHLRIPVTSNIALPAIFASEGDEGILRALDYRGAEVLAAYRNIPLMNWGFVAKIDKGEAFAAVIALRNRIAVLSSLLILTAIGMAFWISRGITNPIVSLEKLTKRIAMGDFSVYPDVKTRDEIGSLAVSLGTMEKEIETSKKQLMDYSRNLEKMVDERTKKLRESEKRYQDLYESAPDMFVSVDVKTSEIIQCNRSVLTTLGYSRDKIVGHSVFKIYHHACIEDAKKVFQSFLETGEMHNAELQLKRKDGRIIDVSLNVSAVRDEQGNIIQTRSIWRDITERKQLEEQLLQSQKMEAVGKLAGGIAHDFNNILTAIMSYGNILQMKMDKDDALRSYVDAILTSSERAAHLTRGLLSFSRKQVLNPVPIELNHIIKKAQSLLSRFIYEDVAFRTNLTDQDLPIMADGAQIEQVLMNLVTNACDAISQGGKLTISTERVEMDKGSIKTHELEKPGKYALLSVTDTGAGMDEETMSRIFEPFFTTKEVGKGTGLGLAITYGIIKQHNGYIKISSTAGEGTTFRIYLPLIEEKIEKRELPEASPILGTETVLIAEDEESVRSSLRLILQEHGFTVIEAVNGVDAIKKFKENKEKIQLLILDVVMPKKKGKEVYEEIKKIRSDIKAVFTSGYSAGNISPEYIHNEGVAFIPKPVSPKDLFKKIRKLLDG